MWSPHTQSSIDAVEMLQRKAARFVCNDFARLSSVTSMLEHLGWDTLEQRRNQLTLLMLYKIINLWRSHIIIFLLAPPPLPEVAPANISTYIQE